MLLSVMGVAIGCANSVEFNSTVTMEEAACRESGDFYDAEPGQFSATLSASGFVKYDTPEDPTKMRAFDLFDLKMAKTKIDWVFAAPGSPKGKAGKAFITNYTETGEQEGKATYSVELQAVGAYGSVDAPDITAPAADPE